MCILLLLEAKNSATLYIYGFRLCTGMMLSSSGRGKSSVILGEGNPLTIGYPNPRSLLTTNGLFYNGKLMVTNKGEIAASES